jgi:hypothetical protein
MIEGDPASMVLVGYVVGAWLAASVPTAALFAVIFRGAERRTAVAALL